MNTLKSRHFGTFCSFGAGHCGHTHEKLAECHLLWRESRMQRAVTSVLAWRSPAWMAVPVLMSCAGPQLLVLLTAPLPASRKPCLHTKQHPWKGCGCPPCPWLSQHRARAALLPTVPPSAVQPVLLSGSDSFRHQIPPVRQES